jgi:glycine cleavage system transcriptional repressor
MTPDVTPSTLLAITSVGPDRPGLVAGLTQLVCQYNGNIDDSTMTRLAGQFAMILIVTLPAPTDEAAFLQAAHQLATQLGIALNITTLAPDTLVSTANPAPQTASADFILTVAGHDRTGITYHITNALAHYGANITDLTARQMQGDNGLVYLMVIEFDLADQAAMAGLHTTLNDLAATMQLDLRCRRMDAVAL